MGSDIIAGFVGETDKDFEINVPFIYYKGYTASIKDGSGKTTDLKVELNKENGDVEPIRGFPNHTVIGVE